MCSTKTLIHTETEVGKREGLTRVREEATLINFSLFLLIVYFTRAMKILELLMAVSIYFVILSAYSLIAVDKLSLVASHFPFRNAL